MNILATDVDFQSNGLLSSRKGPNYTDFIELFKTYRQTIKMLDTQLWELWKDIVTINEKAFGSMAQLHDAMSQVLQQKQEVEALLFKLVEVLGFQVCMAGTIIDESVEVVVYQLRQKVESLEKLMDSINVDRNTLKHQDKQVHSRNQEDEIKTLLQQQVSDNSEQLQASELPLITQNYELERKEMKALNDDTSAFESENHEKKTQFRHDELQGMHKLPQTLKETFHMNEPLENLQIHSSQQQEVDIDKSETLDVIFQDSGPIGLHFQANVPDAGAILRTVLPHTAAAKKNVLQPFDKLIAVNQIAVHTAPFRHIMLLLQGGLRPLTLTFKRQMLVHDSSCLHDVNVKNLDLDEEIVLEEGTFIDLEQLRVTDSPLLLESNQTNEMNAADKILLSLFGLFWNPPMPSGTDTV